jgi:uncharacterized protein (UPF0548 family)
MRSSDRTARRLQALRLEQVTYPEVGGTAGPLPDGYHHVRAERRLGSGTEAFAVAAAALHRWEAQRGAGVRVLATEDTVTDGTVALLRLGPGPLSLGAPIRVVYTLAEARRRGFAYGTLPGHPVTGEEAFVVERRPDDAVVLSITAFSRPASRLTRLAGPFGRAVQRYMVGRYLRALDG